MFSLPFSTDWLGFLSVYFEVCPSEKWKKSTINQGGWPYLSTLSTLSTLFWVKYSVAQDLREIVYTKMKKCMDRVDSTKNYYLTY